MRVLLILAKFRPDKMMYRLGTWKGAKKMSVRSREKNFEKGCKEIF